MVGGKIIKMKKLILIFITLSFLFSSYAISEEISPFGFTLGSKLDSKYFGDDIKMYPSGRCIQKVNPIFPNENF